MTPLEIKIELLKKNISQSEIARQQNVSPMAISYVVNKKRSSKKLMEAIAKAIGKDPVFVFPEYYFQPHTKQAGKSQHVYK